MIALAAAPAYGDPAKCQKTLLTGLRKYKKTFLKAHEKCLDAENLNKIAGPCPDTTATVKIGLTAQKINAKVDVACAAGDLASLGYPSNCMLAPAASDKETMCAGMSVTTPGDFAACLECWKGAELGEFAALVYASHALEVCGALDATSTQCSPLDCTTPTPIQRNLGDSGENDCQRAIGKEAFRYLLRREKLLETCGLAGGTRDECLDPIMNPKVALGIQSAEDKKKAGIKNRCGNRTPTADPPFCCRTGTGNSCTVTASRDDCTTNIMGDVQEGKTCDAGTLTCDPVGGGGQVMTFWESCPKAASCPSMPLANIDDLITCVDSSADAIVDELLCMQFPTGWPCP